MPKYTIGLDSGTNSCRALLVDAGTGKELADDLFPYPSGADGVIVDPCDPVLARQNPAGKVCMPVAAHHLIYEKLYRLYRQLHDGFGTPQWSGPMPNVMKELLEIRDTIRRSGDARSA